LLQSCALGPYDAYIDPKISGSQQCQQDLDFLVERQVFSEVKNLEDKKCNNIVLKGWVKGKTSKKFDKRCKAYFQYIAFRKDVRQTARRFLGNACYVENSNYFDWKSTQL
jgi:hypothetical protein